MAYPPGYGGRVYAATDAQFLAHFDAFNVTDFVHVNNVYKGFFCCFEFSNIIFFALILLLCFFFSITLSFGDSIALKRACYNAYLRVSCTCCFIKSRLLYFYFFVCLSSMLVPFYCCENSNFMSCLSSSNVTDNMLQQHAKLASFSTWYFIVDESCYSHRSLLFEACMPLGTDTAMGYIFDLLSISMPLLVMLMVVSLLLNFLHFEWLCILRLCVHIMSLRLTYPQHFCMVTLIILIATCRCQRGCHAMMQRDMN